LHFQSSLGLPVFGIAYGQELAWSRIQQGLALSIIPHGNLETSLKKNEKKKA
jgi:hypothetical protein